ncbi:MAG: hypothetical protein AB1640_18040 [bacterium]
MILQKGRYRLPSSLLVLFWLAALIAANGCGEGWDGYEDSYESRDTGTPGEPWVGPETVFVVLGDQTVETPLAGIVTSTFSGEAAVRLSDFIIESGITSAPEGYRYDFTATDGYNLLKKRYDDKSLLPGWQEMLHGFLYWNDQGWLETGWEEHPWGSALSAYQVKYMDGGTITLLEPD